MMKSHRQSGAFILATVIFLMVVGAVMLSAMTNLSQVASSGSGLEHQGHMAEAAAMSGMKLCIKELETGACTVYPLISGVSAPTPAPCKIKVNDNGCASGICNITSSACCTDSTSPVHGARKFSIQVQKSATGGVQMIPASLSSILPDTCPLP